jgi:hypothetical protein
MGSTRRQYASTAPSPRTGRLAPRQRSVTNQLFACSADRTRVGNLHRETVDECEKAQRQKGQGLSARNPSFGAVALKSDRNLLGQAWERKGGWGVRAMAQRKAALSDEGRRLAQGKINRIPERGVAINHISDCILGPSIHRKRALRSTREPATSVTGRALSQPVPFISSHPDQLQPRRRAGLFFAKGWKRRSSC